MTTNYFKSKKHFFFFSDAVPESIQTAYEAAVSLDKHVSIYRPIGLTGPWDECPIVGHRRVEVILRDLKKEKTREKIESLHEELISLTMRYSEVGRKAPLPMAA